MTRLRPVFLLAATLLCPLGARAEVNTDQPGAVVVFPKVIYDGTRDTIIQLSNAGGAPVRTRCFYTSPNVDEDNHPIWVTVDFQLTLTRLQPTVWLASTGRPVNPTDRPP